MQMLFYAHSGTRYLVLLAGVVTLAYLITALRRPLDGRGRMLTAIYTGLLDLQVLLGLVLMMTIPFYPALYGHILMMLLASVAIHVTSVTNKRRLEAEASTGLALAGVVISLLLVAGGIMAIGRTIL